MADPMKSRIFRLSDADFALLQAIADSLSESTGFNVTRSDMLRSLVREKAKALGIAVKDGTQRRGSRKP